MKKLCAICMGGSLCILPPPPAILRFAVSPPCCLETPYPPPRGGVEQCFTEIGSVPRVSREEQERAKKGGKYPPPLQILTNDNPYYGEYGAASPPTLRSPRSRPV